MATDSYPLARCANCGEQVGIVYDPAEGAPLVLCAECEREFPFPPEDDAGPTAGSAEERR